MNIQKLDTFVGVVMQIVIILAIIFLVVLVSFQAYHEIKHDDHADAASYRPSQSNPPSRIEWIDFPASALRTSGAGRHHPVPGSLQIPRFAPMSLKEINHVSSGSSG